MNLPFQLTDLPGGELITRGLSDAAARKVTAASCLVCIARSRLGNCGVAIPHDFHISEPEMALYGILGEEPGDAYSHYNAHLRQLIRFCQTLEQQLHRLTQQHRVPTTA